MEKNRSAQWQERLRQWKISGKSGSKWAKEKQIPYPTFCYWRAKLNLSLSKPFVEMIDISKSGQGLLLEWQGIAIRLSNDFDVHALKRFLQVLQDM